MKKAAVQNEKKVSPKLEFEARNKQEAAPAIQGQKQDDVPFDVPDDGFRQLMERSLRDAIEPTRAVNTVQWSVDDIRGIAHAILIQRAKA